MSEEAKVLFPCIPLRGVSIFPNTVIHFDIGREKSIRALEKAMADDKSRCLCLLRRTRMS